MTEKVSEGWAEARSGRVLQAIVMTVLRGVGDGEKGKKERYLRKGSLGFMSDWYGSWREKRDEENFKYSIHNDRKIVMAISTDGNRAVWKRKRIF